jgi:AAA15 family ATPase/GTPase
MIKSLEINNFKSIKSLKLDCKRVNIFIGKPNTGKSNILESLGFFSLSYNNNLVIQEFIRIGSMVDLFYDQDTRRKIEIKADNIYNCEVNFQNGIFVGDCKEQGKTVFHFSYNYQGNGEKSKGTNLQFKLYRFQAMNIFNSKESDFLLPPKGENLLSILLTNKPLAILVANIFNEYGMRLALIPNENKIEVRKEIDYLTIPFNYSLTSDTLQRIIFHLTAIETNRNSTLIFEEPESHAFPYYTKFLAERIAMDKTNQYFIATHNPYLLLPLLEKTSQSEIGIFITYIENYETKVKLLEKEVDCTLKSGHQVKKVF